MKIGILGGGQLARMLALAAHPLGINTVCLDPKPDACAQQVCELQTAEYTDETALASFINEVDVVTIENENIPEQALDFIQQKVPVYPPKQALIASRDRKDEKTLLNDLNIPTAPFAIPETLADCQSAFDKFGEKAILKTRRFGYDGKGQVLITKAENVETAWNALGANNLILEGFVNFDRELSMVSCRSMTGEMRFYPLAENQHQQGILDQSTAPFINEALTKQAIAISKTLAASLNYVGVLAIEFFQLGEQLLVNEFAPRVHNSGHWTIEGAACSQFENHVRAICDLPLGSTEALGHVIMRNCIGSMPATKAVLALPNTHLHNYQKAAKVNRKLGHITIHHTQLDEVKNINKKLSNILDN